VGGESHRRARARAGQIAQLQKPPLFFARRNERVESFCVARAGSIIGFQMTELILAFNAADIRYLLVGGQAMRLTGMPRFSMDWDFFIPPRDGKNFAKLNEILKEEIDMPLVELGAGGENFIQTYQTRWGILQFHLGVAGVPKFDEAEKSAVIRKSEHGIPVKCLSGTHLLSAKRAANRPQDQADIIFLEELQRLGKIS
jgi:hypothetical protein